MGKIINFNNYKDKHTHVSDRHPLYEQEMKYFEMIDDKKALLSAFIDEAIDAIEASGHDSMKFNLNGLSVESFFGNDLDFVTTGNVIDGPDFDYVSQDELLRLTISAQIGEEGMIEFVSSLYCLKDYKLGNRE